MTTIGIIGANGRVGSELCLFLHVREGVNVVAICRSDLSAAFLRRCGIPCRIGSVANEDRAAGLLEGCDVVVDLSLPKGPVSDIRAASDAIIRNAIARSPQRARFVLASTIMTLGVRDPGERLRRRLIAGTAYGAHKRHAERTALHAGRRSGKDVVVLRLGQVHGEMQAVSHQLAAALSTRPAVVPDCSSYAIFVFTIAEAIALVARGRVPTGTYMGVESPDWSWEELARYFARRRGLDLDVRAVAGAGAVDGVAGGWGSRLVSLLVGSLARPREILTGTFLPLVPGLEVRAKVAYTTRRAAAEIARSRAHGFDRPMAWAFLGRAPGPRVPGLPDSRTQMEPAAARVREILDAVVPR